MNWKFWQKKPRYTVAYNIFGDPCVVVKKNGWLLISNGRDYRIDRVESTDYQVDSLTRSKLLDMATAARIDYLNNQ